MHPWASHASASHGPQPIPTLTPHAAPQPRTHSCIPVKVGCNTLLPLEYPMKGTYDSSVGDVITRNPFENKARGRAWPGTAKRDPHASTTRYHWRGGWVGLGWVKASPGRLPTVRAAFPAVPHWAAVLGCPVTRPTGLLTAPRPRGGARGREMPPCLGVCALVCLRGGRGAVADVLAPLLFGVGAHGAGKCVPGAPGSGREAGDPDAEPTGGDVGLGLQPPRHKDKLPNRSTTACWHGKAVVRGTTGVRPRGGGGGKKFLGTAYNFFCAANPRRVGGGGGTQIFSLHI